MARNSSQPELHATIANDEELLSVRQRARAMAEQMGFGTKDVTSIVTAISELTRNMLIYAGGGSLAVRGVDGARGAGIEITAEDKGPGILDIRKALIDGYSTSGGLGMGLPGVRRLMHDFEIHSEPGVGTVVTVRMWLDGR